MNRFSKDLGLLDELIPFILLEIVLVRPPDFNCLYRIAAIIFLQMVMTLVAGCIVVWTVIAWILIPSAGILLLFHYVRKIYLKTGRDVKRVESISK